MAEKNNTKDILLGLAMTSAIALAGWSLKNTIEIKISVAVLDNRVANLEKLLENHAKVPPMALLLTEKGK
jgi:hypothetical protein